MMTAKTDRHLVMQEEEDSRKSYMFNMRQIFERADKDNSGSLSWEEFERHLRDERMLSYFALLGLDALEAKNLFRILDVDSSNDVNIDEFLIGCFRLKGHAKQLDLATLMYENKKMIGRLARFMTYTVEEFDNIKSGIMLLKRTGGPQSRTGALRSQSGMAETSHGSHSTESVSAAAMSAALWPKEPQVV